MKAIALSALLTAAAAAVAVPGGEGSSSTKPAAEKPRIPTSYESAVMARRILALTPLGTLATIFPASNSSSIMTSEEQDNPKMRENRPAEVAGMPHGLMEYISDCEYATNDVGNPTLLAISIETSFKNIAAGSNVSLAVQWTPPPPPFPPHHGRPRHGRPGDHKRKPHHGDDHDDDDEEDDDHHHKDHKKDKRHHKDKKHKDKKKHKKHHPPPPPPRPFSPAALPRFSLLGYVEPIEGGDDRTQEGSIGSQIASCFTKVHPDANWWLPGNRIHESHFVRLVVTQVYWIGGFGDRAYIGWIPVDEWKKVSKEEWEAIRLPGEWEGHHGPHPPKHGKPEHGKPDDGDDEGSDSEDEGEKKNGWVVVQDGKNEDYAVKDL
ncbi:pyridoxamine 5'-phosphate oxidase-domain-containing protein [Sordaria brevicollis]|uniref:Pyridoxamine 5'-phosphate oxidase-domain-containing protein n=1 Tax=Sordaria brevicollis TaxID=83679 RepID=A0AAE0NWI8_SORBR|nr:pyridoxamine 5'-phosphate oxidase-domain-containing protein [Sordaria brevicollis]